VTETLPSPTESNCSQLVAPEMWDVVKSLLGDVRPETIAAVALLMQAVILWLLWSILRRNRHMLEQQTETAKLIAQALEQQTKIMDEQFKFHRKIEAKTERKKIFEAVLGLQTSVVNLIAECSPPSQSETAFEEQQRISHKWIRLEGAIPPCLTDLITATHLSPEEKNYCMDFALDLDAVTKRRSLNTLQMNINGLKAISQAYNDLPKRLEEAVHR
jgi:hypothetical protein